MRSATNHVLCLTSQLHGRLRMRLLPSTIRRLLANRWDGCATVAPLWKIAGGDAVSVPGSGRVRNLRKVSVTFVIPYTIVIWRARYASHVWELGWYT